MVVRLVIIMPALRVGMQFWTLCVLSSVRGAMQSLTPEKPF